MKGFFWGRWFYDNFLWEVRWLDKATVILRSFIINWATIVLEIIFWLFYFFFCLIIEWTSIINKFFFFRWRRYIYWFGLLRCE